MNGPRLDSAHPLAVVLATGRERLGQLRAMAARAPNTDYAALQAAATEARFVFERARQRTPESAEAHEGHGGCVRVWAEAELAFGHLDQASALISELPPASRRDLDAQLSDAREREARARAHLETLERDRDVSFGSAGRRRAFAALGIGVLLLTTVLTLQRNAAAYSPTPGRLAVVGLVVLGLTSTVAFVWSRRSPFNLVNRRIVQVALATLTLSAGQRLIGAYTGEVAERVLFTDAMLLALGGLGLAPFHRGGPWLAAVGFCLAVVGAIWPAWIDELFIAFSVFIPLVFLLFGRNESPTLDASPPP